MRSLSAPLSLGAAPIPCLRPTGQICRKVLGAAIAERLRIKGAKVYTMPNDRRVIAKA